MAHPRRHRAAQLLVGSALALTTMALPRAASAEIVSRVGGDGSLPFPAQLVTASSDGRYVVLQLGTFGAPPATQPEADVTSPSGYVIRDRVSQTIVPIAELDGGQIVQITDDGTRVLVTGESAAPRLVEASTGADLPLLSVPGTITSARVSEDGTKAVLSATTGDEPLAPATIYRGQLGTPGTASFTLPGVTVTDASADLSTVLYDRPTPTVAQPGHPDVVVPGHVVGMQRGADAPHVIAENFLDQTFLGGDRCANTTQLRTRRATYAGIAISADGGRVAYGSRLFDNAMSWPTGAALPSVHVRSPSGPTEQISPRGSVRAIPTFEAFGRAHDLAFVSQFDAIYTSIRYTRLLTNDDQTMLTSGTKNGVSMYPVDANAVRYTTAAAQSAAPPVSSTLAFTGSEPVDTADRVPPTRWIDCESNPDEAAPAGQFSDYALIRRSPVRSSASLGSVLFFTQAAQGKRAATRVTLEVKAFGFTLWRRTLTPGQDVALPRPLPWLPETVSATVHLAPANGTTPAPLRQSFSVFATR